jgi:hypothetical protein
MTQMNNSTSQNQQDTLVKRMIVGAGIGLLLISLFVVPAEANPAWGKFWMIRPLIVTPLAGAMGGLGNYFIVTFHDQAGINKTVAMILGVVILCVGLFLGVVLGLDGTLWD